MAAKQLTPDSRPRRGLHHRTLERYRDKRQEDTRGGSDRLYHKADLHSRPPASITSTPAGFVAIAYCRSRRVVVVIESTSCVESVTPTQAFFLVFFSSSISIATMKSMTRGRASKSDPL